jgi:hypothetical protein
MSNAVRAWLDDCDHIGEGVRFFDIGDNDVNDVPGGRAGDKKHPAVCPPETKTTVDYLANLEREGVSSNHCHLFSLRNHACAGVFGVHVSREEANPEPGGAKASHP